MANTWAYKGSREFRNNKNIHHGLKLQNNRGSGINENIQSILLAELHGSNDEMKQDVSNMAKVRVNFYNLMPLLL